MPPQSSQEQRAIVQRMIDAGESEENIATVIQHFKTINAPEAPKGPQGSASGRAIEGFATGAGINLVPLVKAGAQEVGQQIANPASAVTLPARMAMNVVAPLTGLPAAWQALKEGRYTDAANRAAASIPIIGPAAQHASDRMKSGDTAGGAGEAAGLITSPLVGEALSAVTRGPALSGRQTLTASIAERVSKAAERGSERRMTNVISPQKGANQVRFSNQAAEAAPRLAREEGMSATSRAELADRVSAKLEESTASLDAAHDARNAGQAYETAPIVKALLAEKEKLTSKAVEASTTIPSPSGPVKVKVGSDVIPAPRNPRIAVIDQAINELRQLGSLARYDAIKNIRAAYDDVAKVKYSPAMGQDFLAKAGEATGAADVTRVLREHLANIDPQAAAANKEYSYWRKVNDVMQAAEETERNRPTRGRGIATRTMSVLGGTALGELTGHPSMGVIAGLIVGEAAEKVAQSGATTRIATSRAMAKIADALRAGDSKAARANLDIFAKLTGTTARLKTLLEQQQQEKEPQ